MDKMVQHLKSIGKMAPIINEFADYKKLYDKAVENNEDSFIYEGETHTIEFADKFMHFLVDLIASKF